MNSSVSYIGTRTQGILLYCLDKEGGPSHSQTLQTLDSNYK